MAWRALVLAGVPDDEVLPALEQVLISERRLQEMFATVATVRLDLPAPTGRPCGWPGTRRRCCSPDGRVAPVPAPGGLLLGVRPAPARAPTTWSSTAMTGPC